MSPQAQNVIEVSHLTKKYKNVTAVDDLSFTVRQGEILGFLGPNGSGKSTTLNCVLALLKYQAGEIKVFGRPMTPSSYETKARIGVVFQDIAVFDELSVRDNVDYFCGLYVKDKSQRQKDVDEALEFTGLTEHAAKRPRELSTGLARRLNIACGIAHKPDLLFADEPTASIDPQSRSSILEGFQKLKEGGTTIVYTTHYMEEVEQICDRVIIIDKGHIIASGTVDELKELSSIHEKISVQIADLDTRHLCELKALPHVQEVKVSGSEVHLSYSEGEASLESLLEYLRSSGLSYDKVYSERPTLNDVFLELTGKELRD